MFAQEFALGAPPIFLIKNIYIIKTHKFGHRLLTNKLIYVNFCLTKFAKSKEVKMEFFKFAVL